MGVTEQVFLEQYSDKQYEKPSVATDVVAFSIFSKEEENYRKIPQQSLNVLLIRRGEHPFKDQWALPGGFVKPDETVDETARRELEEETGVKDVYMEQLYTFSEVMRDPRTRVISAAYMALLHQCPELSASTDAVDAAWFKVGYQLEKTEKEQLEACVVKKDYYKLDLSGEGVVLSAQILFTKRIKGGKLNMTYTLLGNEGIAFDHAKIIAFAVERLRGKMDYTDVGFYLLPELFTLTGLQKIHEVVLDKELTAANFRRKIMSKVVETDQIEEGGGYRNAKLFRRNDEWL